jgi:hypothetical protein
MKSKQTVLKRRIKRWRLSANNRNVFLVPTAEMSYGRESNQQAAVQVQGRDSPETPSAH